MPLTIACDFDGTITRLDTIDAILENFALPAWEDVESEWKAGRIGSRECLAGQTDLLRVDPATLDAFIDGLEFDADAAGFFADCKASGLAVQVVSDGYDWVVRRVLSRMGVTGVPIFANRLTHLGDDRWAARFPYSAPQCGSGVCKCSVVKAARRKVHIGDGRSDACAADGADIVFAKGWLLESRNKRGLASIPFDSFAEIRALLPMVEDLSRVAAQKIA